ncbi:hypothetical protein BASA50_008679 [Batrachochytrium salamandrivorans]|uniref:Uncharacterized protein n=1 Tax=Batrachochytrium salamandrivorans TaxID=1357716 RepID=A0ABQ8F3I7_9FUNG|nr:hypothetical protein BASA60_010219 [Batrachochytrium salamandrivorans]KAH6565068.1 hypothetical protein BASA62_007526 [Batrachochytrium salamandrivorans]KAH6591503.1 hypothetical protein BASA50_008679 [Batrachochytrium salamandrivorans]KAH6602209.1 hypothetical protein BASA61_001333 [Batrachochytrium salamandrivorans]KAH9274787.1 hypothetical protein BASA83_002994 [Batrachochytrium salamandrivorans]
MKVRVLVVAAMVITSVNANWLDTFMGWLGINSSSQGSVLPSDSPEHGPGSVLPSDSPEHGPGSVLPSNSQDSTLNDTQDLDPYNQDPADGSDDGDEESTCGSIIADLTGLQVIMLELDEDFRAWLPTLYNLKKKAVDGLKDEEMDDYHVWRRKVEAMLEDIKVEFINLNAKYSEGWATLIAKGCLDDHVHLMSPEGMMQISMFFDELQSSSGYEKSPEKGVRILDRK